MQFHILSFEGPDPYAQAGGIASRVTGLTQALADAGFETHLWFVGDPELPGHERHDGLHLHRWCQWISRYHPGEVYDGEEGKRADYAASLPPSLCQEVLLPYLVGGGKATILAEEWHPVDAVLHLDWLLRQAGVRQQVTLFWNANNTFSFSGAFSCLACTAWPSHGFPCLPVEGPDGKATTPTGRAYQAMAAVPSHPRWRSETPMVHA